jgi:protein ImuA
MPQARRDLAADPLVLTPELVLARARAHEIAGAARIAFALLVAARLSGPVFWLQSPWTGDRLMGDGVRAILDPGRLLIGRGRSPRELQWCAEEALRTGLVPLVVMELAEPPALTPVRRLHLAAEEGARFRAAPLVLLLTPGDGGAAGVESRWRVDPVPGWARQGGPRWRLTRLRARMAPERTWDAALPGGRLRLTPV